MKLKSGDEPYNRRGKYECEKCVEKFRLGSSLWMHKHNGCEADKPLVSFKN